MRKLDITDEQLMLVGSTKNTKEEVAEALGVSPRWVDSAVRRLAEQGKVRRKGDMPFITRIENA